MEKRKLNPEDASEEQRDPKRALVEGGAPAAAAAAGASAAPEQGPPQLTAAAASADPTQQQQQPQHQNNALNPLQRARDGRWVCPFCNAHLTTKGSLATHVQSKHEGSFREEKQ